MWPTRTCLRTQPLLGHFCRQESQVRSPHAGGAHCDHESVLVPRPPRPTRHTRRGNHLPPPQRLPTTTKLGTFTSPGGFHLRAARRTPPPPPLPRHSSRTGYTHVKLFGCALADAGRRNGPCAAGELPPLPSSISLPQVRCPALHRCCSPATSLRHLSQVPRTYLGSLERRRLLNTFPSTPRTGDRPERARSRHPNVRQT